MNALKQNKPTLPEGIYGITAEQFSNGRSNIDTVQAMIAGGVRIIQYREKRPFKSHRQMLTECRAIRRLTRDAGILFVVNDYVDIALLVEADGIHVGQDDLPVPDVRRLVGPDMLIGLSTHAPDHVHAAAALGADYIGVGPIFSTQTKEDVVDPVGFDYLDHAVQHAGLPIVAIGGIKKHNIAQVARHGARCFALVTEIVGATDIAATVRELNHIITNA
jgi:thiamine-phosphate pyrophosphorylase